LAELRSLVNVSDEDWPLFVGCLLDILKGAGPYFVITASGVQGSAKTSLCRVLLRLTDPQRAELLTLHRKDRDFMTYVRGNHLIAYDIVSKLDQWQSDAFCRLSTGGGVVARRMYTDDDPRIVGAVAGAEPSQRRAVSEIKHTPQRAVAPGTR